MMNWIKSGKFTTYILFGIAFIFSVVSVVISIYMDMGTSEFRALIDLINEKGTPGFAIIGIIIVLIILFIIVQMFFGACIAYLVARFIFRILIDFKTFYRITLIFNFLLSLVVIWELFLYKGNVSFLVIVTNPLLILGFIVLFWLLKKLADVHWLKPLLFTIFVFISYLVFSNISLGG
ncbi:hypothetical protein [Bacillus bingmayongensis]|uniref:hypothetical protein n=1 Tax=Bacillus bingmayongensis TaxID=1150157 RepID=UPI0002EB9A04|nr:hypothetical protein [Bacillus bingmayongensis]MBY0595093.1 hypothetical protein [Bacillus bingmayongensis]